MRVPVDQTAFADGIRFQFAEPVAVYENNRRVDGKQAVDADGVPLWSVQILILRAGRRSELETVKCHRLSPSISRRPRQSCSTA